MGSKAPRSGQIVLGWVCATVRIYKTAPHGRSRPQVSPPSPETFNFPIINMLKSPSFRRAVVLGACFGVWAEAQSFLSAISQFPQLSNFTTLMNDNLGLAGALLTSKATSLTQITVLVPDNFAFNSLEAKLGVPIGS